MGRVSDAKQRLMDAAMELVWEQSYGAVTIDAICEKAEVKKGSFYYFFDSKSDLASAALTASWEKKKTEYDALFSPTVPPLERLTNYFDLVYRRQAETQKHCGRVLGCPLFTLASEICTQDPHLLKTIEQILAQYVKYFETAIRDAHAQKAISAPDAGAKAKLLFAYFQGTLTQARIQNNAELLKRLGQGALELLGRKEAAAKAA